MYLKTLEVVGFKSFASKTTLSFEPGMTCIVGPNGCGKSNVSDAVRWVLGEQSAKALRGSKMEDCIFNGTDKRKPLGMAEVSITFADCEHLLETEFNEVTITRRVFRSGEGEYLLNKTPCRLKDIQRLFMGTGIGTTSYSVLEQGRIDRILSSRPEDRRVVFEEASGITKFKNDKKEAILKLEHTEANLLRLADVIREVKRQIGSLQRQAGKARRYKTLSDELRKLDVYASRQRVGNIDSELRDIESKISGMDKLLEKAKNDIAETDRNNIALRKSLLGAEHDIGSALENAATAGSRLEHNRDLIRANTQRIEEYRRLEARDERESERTREQMRDQHRAMEELAARIEQLKQERDTAGRELESCRTVFAEHQKEISGTRRRIGDLRSELTELESAHSKLQNELVKEQSRSRAEAIQRERLMAEQSQIRRSVDMYGKRRAEMEDAIGALRRELSEIQARADDASRRREENGLAADNLRSEIAELRSAKASADAGIEILSVPGKPTPAGATRALLDSADSLGIDSASVLGTLLSHLDIDGEYRIAVEAALRHTIDAVVIRNHADMLDILARLQQSDAGGARLVSLDCLSAQEPAGNNDLAGHVRCPADMRPMIERLLADTILVDSVSGIDPSSTGKAVCVTLKGTVVRPDGTAELWAPDKEIPKTLSELERQTTESSERIKGCEAKLAALATERAELDSELAAVSAELDGSKHALAVREGEAGHVAHESEKAQSRLETVVWELQNLDADRKEDAGPGKTIPEQIDDNRTRRDGAVREMETLAGALRKLEEQHETLQSELTDRTVKFTALRHEMESLEHRHESGKTHLAQLERLIADRTEGIASYESNIATLRKEMEDARNLLAPLEKEIAAGNAKAEELRVRREEISSKLETAENDLAAMRDNLEQMRNARSDLSLKQNEKRMRRQNILERVGSEYGMDENRLAAEPEPDWSDGRPETEALETTIEELRTKLEAMGPVNLVAIEEHKELEERHAFLTRQQEDLVQSKQQLLDMIRKINRTTSEMFKSTFDQVNENFSSMFKKLFNGGSAKLVMVDEEDVLESGIEIIARPPGKRLQNISLLSGGERTLTAVALLFAIYMIKPSPFCLLDELDAALDESNIGRFVNVLQGFLGQSQFVVITHNRQTISAASVIYGVTMSEEGISRTVSMKFKDGQEQPVPA